MPRPTLLQNIAPCYRNAFTPKRPAGAGHHAMGFKRLARPSSTSAQHAVPPSILRNPLRWYVSKLETHPLTTKIITSGLMSGCGDLLCQYLVAEKSTTSSSQSSSSSSSIDDDEQQQRHSNNESTKNQPLDWMRTLRFTILGSFLVAPTVHVWSGFLDSIRQ